VPVKKPPVVVEPAEVEEESHPSRADDSLDPRRGPLALKARFTVQVAALESRDMAEKMIGRLRAGGHPAYYYDVRIKGKTYYRVRCGRFLSRSEAEAYARSLSRKEGVKGFVSELE
jgi:cell division septation protein DedD